MYFNWIFFFRCATPFTFKDRQIFSFVHKLQPNCAPTSAIMKFAILLLIAFVALTILLISCLIYYPRPDNKNLALGPESPYNSNTSTIRIVPQE